jgi:hypothetical protein
MSDQTDSDRELQEIMADLGLTSDALERAKALAASMGPEEEPKFEVEWPDLAEAGEFMIRLGAGKRLVSATALGAVKLIRLGEPLQGIPLIEARQIALTAADLNPLRTVGKSMLIAGTWVAEDNPETGEALAALGMIILYLAGKGAAGGPG